MSSLLRVLAASSSDAPGPGEERDGVKEGVRPDASRHDADRSRSDGGIGLEHKEGYDRIEN